MVEKRKKERNLKSSMRENKRYLLVDRGREEVEKAILDYVGILGFSKSSPVFISSRIFAVNREMLNEIRAGFALAGIKILRVSGTIKGLN